MEVTFFLCTFANKMQKNMAKSEEYYRRLFGPYYSDLLLTKLSLTQKDKDRIVKRLKKIYTKQKYWANKENHLGTCCCESDWLRLKYAEAKCREYENEIALSEFYIS